MSTLQELCHCGNHKDSHHEGKGVCLAVGCNDCLEFCDRTKPDTRKKPKPVRPAHHDDCLCVRCKEYRNAA